MHNEIKVVTTTEVKSRVLDIVKSPVPMRERAEKLDSLKWPISGMMLLFGLSVGIYGALPMEGFVKFLVGVGMFTVIGVINTEIMRRAALKYRTRVAESCSRHYATKISNTLQEERETHD